MLSFLSETAPELLLSCGRQLAYTTIVFFVVIVLLRFFPRMSPTLRYALWSLVLLRLVLPPDLSAPWSLSNLVSASSLETVGFHSSSPVPQPTIFEALESVEPHGQPRSSAAYILLLWLVGAAFALFRFASKRRRHARKLETLVQESSILERLEFWRSEFNIKRPIQLFTGTTASSPFTLGSLRPRIFIPRILLEPGRSKTLDTVLAHELVHVQRWDDLALMTERFLASVYFFFPPARWAANRRALEREALCDQAVLACGISHRTYAHALLEVVRLNLSGDFSIATFAQPRSTLTMRLRTILDSPQQRPTTRLPTLTTLFLGVLLLPMAAVPKSLAEPDPPETESVTSTTETVRPPLLHPLPQGRLTAQFGPWKHPIRKEKVHHNGIDLAADEGQEIVAPSNGVVSHTRPVEEDDDGYGTTLEIDHGQGVTTHYYHLAEVHAKTGQQVTRGQVIATVGNTGKSTGPHLHFEVRVKGELVDPQEWLGR